MNLNSVRIFWGLWFYISVFTLWVNYEIITLWLTGIVREFWFLLILWGLVHMISTSIVAAYGTRPVSGGDSENI